MTTIWAVAKLGGNGAAALWTSLWRLEFKGAWLGIAGFIEDPAATAAFQEGLSPLDGNQRNEEKADIVVKPFETG